jgi:hypothetical protein
MYRFTTPTVEETPAGGGPLFSRMTLHQGISVLRTQGVYSSYRYPSQGEVLAAEEVYLGGHIYEVDNDAATRLTAAGYGDYLEAI